MPNNELLLKERAEAFKGLKSLVYGGGNIGNDGKDDGGHRSLHGNLLFDYWQTIERALTAPDQTETIRALVEALVNTTIVELPPETESYKYKVPMAMIPMDDWERVEQALAEKARGA